MCIFRDELFLMLAHIPRDYDIIVSLQCCDISRHYVKLVDESDS